jgi:hypothetical protein
MCAKVNVLMVLLRELFYSIRDVKVELMQHSSHDGEWFSHDIENIVACLQNFP